MRNIIVRANNTCGTQCQVSSINSTARAEVKCRKVQKNRALLTKGVCLQSSGNEVIKL